MWDQGVWKGEQTFFLSEEKGGPGVERSELISSSPGIKYEGEVIRSCKRRSRNCVSPVFLPLHTSCCQKQTPALLSAYPCCLDRLANQPLCLGLGPRTPSWNSCSLPSRMALVQALHSLGLFPSRR